MFVPLLMGVGTPADEIGSLTQQAVDYFKLLLVLAAILILAYLTIRFWVPNLMGVKALQSGPIRVVARFPLEPRKNLYIVRVGSDFFLIGTSEGKIHYLTTLDSDKVEPFLQQEARTEFGGEFGRLLKSFKQRRKS